MSMKTSIRGITLVALALVAGCSRSEPSMGHAPRKESASAEAGWKVVTTSGVSFQLPSDWKSIEMKKESIDQGLDLAFGKDPKYAYLREQTAVMAQQGLVKLLAFDRSHFSG